jgi:hypothetical protein
MLSELPRGTASREHFHRAYRYFYSTPCLHLHCNESRLCISAANLARGSAISIGGVAEGSGTEHHTC